MILTASSPTSGAATADRRRQISCCTNSHAFETNSPPTSRPTHLAVAGAEPLRVLIEAGTLVRVVAVYALLSSDDSVEVIGFDLDVSGSFADDD